MLLWAESLRGYFSDAGKKAMMEILRKNQQASEFAPPWNELWHDQKHSLCFDPQKFEQTWVQVADKNLPEGSVMQRIIIWLHSTLASQSE